MKNSFKTRLVYRCILMSLILVGCNNQKNPLLNEAMISHLKGSYFFESPDSFPIRECANYYSDPSSAPSLRMKCDEWSEKTYKEWLNGGTLPSATTLENFRDAQLWQKVKPIK